MAKQTTLNIRIDEDSKRDFDAFCSNVGLNASVTINMFIQTVLRKRKIPFEITDEADPFYSESNMKVLLQSIAQLDAGKGFIRELIEVDDDE